MPLFNNLQSAILNLEPLPPGQRLQTSDLPAAMPDMVKSNIKRRG
jgi:hypothetical protein